MYLFVEHFNAQIPPSGSTLHDSQLSHSSPHCIHPMLCLDDVSGALICLLGSVPTDGGLGRGYYGKGFHISSEAAQTQLLKVASLSNRVNSCIKCYIYWFSNFNRKMILVLVISD